ncbi:ATP-binding protein [Oligoflexia bacterium]|nr:ATP-binding protein [Oligoflexia bacterium]
MSKFPVVVILGARQVGKSTLLRMIAENAQVYDLEDDTTRDLIERDPAFFFAQRSGESPIVIDEAQIIPRLFSALRVAVDKRRSENGQFLLTGSSSPQLQKHVSESLAGRVAVFELGNLALEEIYSGSPSGLYQVLKEMQPEKLGSLTPQYDYPQLIQAVIRGGYPEVIASKMNITDFELWMKNYIRTYIERDIRTLFPSLQIETYRRFVGMLAHSTGQLLNFSNFARSLDVSQPSIKSYFDIVHGTFIWRKLPSFERAVIKSVVKMPKGILRDSGIASFLLKIPSQDLLEQHPLCGSIWESFVIEQLISGLENELYVFDYYYYRSKAGIEVDLVIDGSKGMVPIEIKLTPKLTSEHIAPLKHFVKQQKCPFGIIVNAGERVMEVAPGIFQVPAGCL